MKPDAYPLIDLSCENDNYLVVLHPTGVKVCGQVGGTSCLHPEVEGFPVKVMGDFDSLSRESCRLRCWGDPFDISDLEALRKFFPFKMDNFEIVLDEERIGEGTEAWIPVKTKTLDSLEIWRTDPLARFLDGKKGFLLVGNCD